MLLLAWVCKWYYNGAYRVVSTTSRLVTVVVYAMTLRMSTGTHVSIHLFKASLDALYCLFKSMRESWMRKECVCLCESVSLCVSVF